MSLVDQTNEVIPLALSKGELYVDLDSDSSVWPEPWVWIDHSEDEENNLKLTLAEADLLYQRLGLILGKPVVKNFEEALVVDFADRSSLRVVGEYAVWEKP